MYSIHNIYIHHFDIKRISVRTNSVRAHYCLHVSTYLYQHDSALPVAALLCLALAHIYLFICIFCTSVAQRCQLRRDLTLAHIYRSICITCTSVAQRCGLQHGVTLLRRKGSLQVFHPRASASVLLLGIESYDTGDERAVSVYLLMRKPYKLDIFCTSVQLVTNLC